MERREYYIDPKDHPLPFTRENFARDFSDGDRDVMTLQPMYEIGLYCLICNRGYGMSKLREPKGLKDRTGLSDKV